jgi:enoyl-CoA hydratase/carnithine racemase
VSRLVGRLLTFPLPTIAVIDGVASCGGAFLAFAHDFRIMNAQNGEVYLTEIDMDFPIPEAGCYLMRAILPPNVAREMIYGLTYDAKMCLEGQVVNKLYLDTDERDAQVNQYIEKYSPKGIFKTTI